MVMVAMAVIDKAVAGPDHVDADTRKCNTRCNESKNLTVMGDGFTDTVMSDQSAARGTQSARKLGNHKRNNDNKSDVGTGRPATKSAHFVSVALVSNAAAPNGAKLANTGPHNNDATSFCCKRVSDGSTGTRTVAANAFSAAEAATVCPDDDDDAAAGPGLLADCAVA